MIRFKQGHDRNLRHRYDVVNADRYFLTYICSNTYVCKVR